MLRPGDPDVRPCVARVSARAAGVFGVSEPYVRRGVVPAAVPVVVGSRSGRVEWVPERHRRRVRMGIDT